MARRSTAAGGPRRGGRLRSLPRRFVAGVLIGIGTVVGAKGDREQHWSIPPTMVADGTDQGTGADGEGDDGPGEVGLPACA